MLKAYTYHIIFDDGSEHGGVAIVGVLAYSKKEAYKSLEKAASKKGWAIMEFLGWKKVRPGLVI